MDDEDDTPRHTKLRVPKSGLIHLLPSFHGLTGEDPHKHLKEFHVVCSGLKPKRVTEEQVKLRAFPFSLKDKAKDWLYYLPSGSITTWTEMQRLFLEKFFPSSRAANIRKEICGIRQACGETLYEYWERFKQLCTSCQHHQIPEQILIQYFYEGLAPIDRSMIDAASGGALVNKTPDEARQLISTMAENSQQFGTRSNSTTKQVNEVNNSNIENKFAELVSLVRQIAADKVQPEKVCGVCSSVGHHTDECPSLQEDFQQANAIGGFLGQPQRNYDPYSNTYNSGWRDHPNFNYGSQGGQPRFQNQSYSRQPQVHEPYKPSTSNSGMPLEDIVKSLAESTFKFQQKMEAEIQNLGSQVAQLTTSVHKLEAQNSGKLTSQTMVNPKENACAITLLSGEEVQSSPPPTREEKQKEPPTVAKKDPKVNCNPIPLIPSKLASFPSRFAKSKDDYEKEVLETFRKVEVNTPLLDAIKKIPMYAKLLKEFCTNKRKLKIDERVRVGENVSAVIKKSLPTKCKDPGMFTMPCVIGNKRIEHAMLDLGASINVMPYSIYNALNLGPLKETRVVIQLADRSNSYPEGVVEDVLVQVNELIFPVDFYILKMENDASRNSAPLLLGRPFMKTARTKIDVHEGTLSVEFDGEIVKFNIFDTMKYPENSSTVYHVDVIDSLVQENFQEKESLCELEEGEQASDDSSNEMKKGIEKFEIEMPNTYKKMLPSILQALIVELNILPDNVKYVHLGEDETLMMIIAKSLTTEQEESLIKVLQEHKMEIGWTLANIKGISPSACIHRIFLEEADLNRKLQVQELKELHLEVYDDSRIYKENTKLFHDSMILRKQFQIGQKVLLYSSRLKLMSGKLHSRWIGHFVVINSFPCGTVEIKSIEMDKVFKVNEHHLKVFHEGFKEEPESELSVELPYYEND
ncbi:uncharacterized protein [Euphorbia lathyris]|uniref:uncharacterized protein n=1 Tax=Euphorbia lathyris TaxID=212925 RepID=UPI0033138548